MGDNNIREIVLTGTTTDPQLYRHEARLLAWLREQLPPDKGVQISLHTNGQLALCKMEIFNQYNRVYLSFPSFQPDIYHQLTGSATMPNLAEIMRQATVPVKISCIINRHNINDAEEFLDRCGAIGIKRVVFRQLYGDTRPWNILPQLSPTSTYRGNPVYHYHGIEVTLWNFQQARSRSLNLFSNGTISTCYLLTQAHGSNIPQPQPR